MIASVAYYTDSTLDNTKYYTYDAYNRVAHSSGTNGDSTSYSYSGNTLVAATWGSGVYGQKITYTLTNGRITSYYGGTDPNQVSSGGSYTYDEAGYLVSGSTFQLSHSSQSGTYSYVSGNCVSIIYTAVMQIPYSYCYQYGNAANSLGNANYGMTFFGKDNANLPTSAVFIFNNNDTTFTQYTYDFATDSTVLKRRLAITHGTTSISRTEMYTYR